ncbi:hypothetical protein PPN31114_00657 [Pandoraea pneumonica]|uniref:Uncharacterized protein n=1 Tax=Pandoraea pneumonica TaxID=2508299 RepID=A0A5E4S9G3_9BURK|nr:hypothetical protein [Pandoraea pneumonica]VVD71955.1 hypothetical protein PPN31114_00657 [Pandoraea pneumonica]
MSTPTTFDIVFEAQDAQQVMAALAELPFKRVYELIGTLNRQAVDANAGEPITCALDAQAFALIVEALGYLPYHQVHGLIDAMKGQLHSARMALAETGDDVPRASGIRGVVSR